MQSKGYKIVGVDISQKAIDRARESAKILKLKNSKFLRMNFPREVPKEKFDLVIFTEVIEHLYNDDLALKKIFSLLNPGGIVIMSTPSKNAPLYKLGLAEEFDQKVGHLRRYTVEVLTNKSEKAGFVILDTKKTEGIIRNFLYLNSIAGKFIRFIRYFFVDLFLAIDWVSMKLFGESDIFVIAQKPE